MGRDSTSWEGVPDHIYACLQEVAGAENAPVRLQGPASRAPETGRDDEAGEMSEEHSGCEGEEQRPAHVPTDDAAEVSIAVDPIHGIKPVKMVQALPGNIHALNQHAATILRNEKRA